MTSIFNYANRELSEFDNKIIRRQIVTTIRTFKMTPEAISSESDWQSRGRDFEPDRA